MRWYWIVLLILPPVLADHLRATVDAVVARAYGLDHAAFAQVLRGFSHKSRPDAPDRCLAAFDAQERAPRREVA